MDKSRFFLAMVVLLLWAPASAKVVTAHVKTCPAMFRDGSCKLQCTEQHRAGRDLGGVCLNGIISLESNGDLVLKGLDPAMRKMFIEMSKPAK